MKKIETELEDCYILEPNRFGDNRGYFSPVYINQELKELGFAGLVQISRSKSSKSIKRIKRNRFWNRKTKNKNKKSRVNYGNIK